MNISYSMYRGVQLKDMTKDELIIVVNEMGNELHKARMQHNEELEHIRKFRK